MNTAASLRVGTDDSTAAVGASSPFIEIFIISTVKRYQCCCVCYAVLQLPDISLELALGRNARRCCVYWGLLLRNMVMLKPMQDRIYARIQSSRPACINDTWEEDTLTIMPLVTLQLHHCACCLIARGELVALPYSQGPDPASAKYRRCTRLTGSSVYLGDCWWPPASASHLCNCQVSRECFRRKTKSAV